MITSWSLRLLTVVVGTVLIASATPADANTLTQDAQLDGPVIFPSKNDITLQSGQNFTLRCRGKKPVQFKQQETPEDRTGPFNWEQRKITVPDSEYEVELNLYNVDRYAVGYYACFDDTFASADVLSNIIEEPTNTAHISYIYIYVNGSDVFAPMRSLVLAKSNSKFVIECRPTTPDIIVNLVDFPDVQCESYNPKIGFVLDSDVLSGLSNALPSILRCEFVIHGNRVYNEVIVYKHKIRPPPDPVISGGALYFLEGEKFSINCTVQTETNSPVDLSWTIPGEFSKVTNSSNAYAVIADDPILYNNYTIANATEKDGGKYVCTSKNSNGIKSVSFRKQYLKDPVINMTKSNKGSPIEVINQNLLRLKVNIIEYPPTDIVVLRDNDVLPAESKVVTSISHDVKDGTAMCTITIRPISVEDTGNYTVVATNRYVSKNVTFDVRVPGSPTVYFESNSDKRYLKGTTASLVCDAIGYPLPEINWVFSHDNGETLLHNVTQNHNVNSLYGVTSLLEIPVNLPGNIICEAINDRGNDSASVSFPVYELPGGFGIKYRNQTWFSENDKVALTCLASKYDFTNVTWYGADYEEMESGVTLEYFDNSLSYIAKLRMERISVNQAGGYMCVGIRNNGSEENETIFITVAETQELHISEPMDENEEVLPYHSINFTCTASAVPPPQITWYKDDEQLLDDVNIEVITDNSDAVVDPTTRRSTLKILQIQEENTGKYECRAHGHQSYRSKFYNVQIKEKPSHKVTYLSVIGVIFFVLILLVVYLAWKIRKEKQFRKELAAAGLLNFKEGVTKSINPDLGIDEQAELLPYNEKFEFPADKLILGKQLGAGAFGVVYKAEARGIINAEDTTTVAVKMVKKTADNMYIKALASELKIMVHLGKHVNIVNLVGACTKNVGKRELIVIVEYCKYGNIHNYMQKHRDVFIDQLTDNPEKNLGKINRGYSCSSGNSGMHSDYFGSNHTQDTDNTFLNTANTNRSGRKVSETGYVQPEWRSNYESDYSFDGRTPRPLCSRDLLAWAFQIARGMEYLASRKVLHGDLAARNVLLAEDNIVKICDFGLARSIYKNDEYQKKENSPLPVKWLAIECMTDRIFSTQSDVWSFGIVLWELFTLAKTPYPNVSPPSLLQWLSEGHRLKKPTYADDKLYDVMMRCWEQKPNARPTFSQLQQILGSFLEDNVRNHYVDLNATYMDMNIRQEGEDYLAMVNAPDYNNIVTPSPHHYVNDSRGFRNFFPQTPTQLEHDDEGYLQMSPATRQTIFNARAQGTKFDFDARKLSPRACEPNSYGSESTPMLTLNNLPRSGSESDHEGSSSPYLNMCPRIEEETDEVFETKQNNVKNIQPSAVTNPTYITFSTDDEKKNQNYANNYININVPNGLVK